MRTVSWRCSTTSELASAVIGGVSLGANVALQCAAQAPARVKGLLLEMPVLEWAVPGAALVFLPLLIGCPLRRQSVPSAGRRGEGPTQDFELGDRGVESSGLARSGGIGRSASRSFRWTDRADSRATQSDQQRRRS